MEIKQRIGDVEGEAATLHQLAGIYANQGEVEQAIALYNQSLDITRRISNVQGEAATLAMLGKLLADGCNEYITATVYTQVAASTLPMYCLTLLMYHLKLAMYCLILLMYHLKLLMYRLTVKGVGLRFQTLTPHI